MWKMRHGLGGSFGGCEDYEWEDLPGITTEEEASKEAYRAACEDYERYEGLHGLRTIDQIIEEEQCQPHRSRRYIQ